MTKGAIPTAAQCNNAEHLIFTIMIIKLSTEKTCDRQFIILPTIAMDLNNNSDTKVDFVVSFAWIRYAASARICWKRNTNKKLLTNFNKEF